MTAENLPRTLDFRRLIDASDLLIAELTFHVDRLKKEHTDNRGLQELAEDYQHAAETLRVLRRFHKKRLDRAVERDPNPRQQEL